MIGIDTEQEKQAPLPHYEREVQELDITKEQKRLAEHIIYNSPQKYIDFYENGDEQIKEFMILLATATPEKVREAHEVLRQELAKQKAERAKGQATE